MQIAETALPGVMMLTPRRFADARGFFSESWNARVLENAGLRRDWVQDNHSVSHPVNTLRGLHYQAPPHAQAKLVRCGQGAVFDVAVDIRVGSPTYGRWVGVELTADNGLQLFIPEGFAHGFVTRAPGSEILYKCSDFYDGPSDRGLRWDCPMIGIDWGLTGDPVLSDKDAHAPGLAGYDSPFQWAAS